MDINGFTLIEASDIEKASFYRDKNAHKGLYGRTLVIAGSKDIYGACFLCAKAAFVSGAGLVKIVTHENNRYTLQHDLPEAMFSFYEGSFKDALLKDLGTFDTIVTGPGLATGETAHSLVRTVAENADVSRQILIFDADALNIFAEDRVLFERLSRKVKDGKGRVVITPHEGELKRLAKGLSDGYNELSSDKDLDIFADRFYENYGIVLVRKGANTRIYGEKRYINTTGNDGMATAGSGDVLAGIMGGALRRYALGGESDFAKTVAFAVYLHGFAGNLACEKLGPVRMMARDILDNIKL